MEQIVIWGTGAHAVAIVDAIKEKCEPQVWALICENGAAREEWSRSGLRIIVKEDLPEARDFGVRRLIVAISDNSARASCARWVNDQGFSLLAVVHPRAVISPSAEIGKGSFVEAGAVINPGARIGEAVFVGSGASIDHDCQIEDAASIAAGVILGGVVTVGKRSRLDHGTCVRDGVTIGHDAVITMGSAVVSNIGDGVTAAGVPARPIEQGMAHE